MHRTQFILEAFLDLCYISYAAGQGSAGISINADEDRIMPCYCMLVVHNGRRALAQVMKIKSGYRILYNGRLGREKSSKIVFTLSWKVLE